MTSGHSGLTKVSATHACCASRPLRPPPYFRRLVGWRRFPSNSGGSCSSSSSFARFFHEAAFPLFSTNKALTGSVSFNYSVPLPLYMYNVLSTRSRSLAARPAVGLQHSPLSVCRTPPACSAAKIHARWHRRTVIVVSAAPSRLRRIPSTGTSSWGSFRGLQKSVPMGSFIAVILLAIADSDAA